MSNSHHHLWVEVLRDIRPSIWDGLKKGKIIERCDCGRQRFTLLTRLGYSVKEF